jgi:hypothetical protein
LTEVTSPNEIQKVGVNDALEFGPGSCVRQSSTATLIDRIDGDHSMEALASG